MNANSDQPQQETVITMTKVEFLHSLASPFWLAHRSFGPELNSFIVREEEGVHIVRTALTRSPFVTSAHRLHWGQTVLSDYEVPNKRYLSDDTVIAITDWEESACRCQKPSTRCTTGERYPALERVTAKEYAALMAG